MPIVCRFPGFFYVDNLTNYDYRLFCFFLPNLYSFISFTRCNELANFTLLNPHLIPDFKGDRSIISAEQLHISLAQRCVLMGT